MADSNLSRKGNIQKHGGATDATVHSFSEDETYAFADYINNALKGDNDIADLLPLNPSDDSLFRAVHNGLLLCKLINDAVPNTIDERTINKGKLNTFTINENQNLVVNSARAIGCNVVNIGAEDLKEGRPHLVLGLVWQIIRIGLFSRINLVNHPELYRLLEDGETIEDLLKLPVDQILLRWFNYHLKNAGWNRRVNNFSGDIKDSENYTVLLAQIAPEHCNRDGLNENDLSRRAEMVLQNAEKLECRKFVTARDICNGQPKLNLAFVANLFNHWPALEPVEEVELPVIEETREEKTYRNWMNSLGVDPFVNYLYSDLTDGLVLLQLFDKIEPGCVDWKKVNKPPKNNFNKLENCNYAVSLGKQLKFSLVGIDGKDIMDGNKTLTLAILWQMMRHHVLSVLRRLGNGKEVGDADLINWGNQKISAAGKSSSPINTFKDGNLRTGLYICDLIDSIQSGSINYDLLEQGTLTDEQCMSNAQYAVSTARKIGAAVFCLPEDVVEIKNKMIMTFFASLMAVDMGQQ